MIARWLAAVGVIATGTMRCLTLNRWSAIYITVSAPALAERGADAAVVMIA